MASLDQILAHLALCDPEFGNGLDRRVDRREYVQKIITRATRVEAWHGGHLIGLVAMYTNDELARVGYVTHVSVTTAHQGTGIARTLLTEAMRLASMHGMQRLDLEVADINERAQKLYLSLGFLNVRKVGESAIMSRALDPELELNDD